MPVSAARQRWLDSHRHELNLDSSKRRDEARANGLCGQCLNREATPGFSSCEVCRSDNRKRMRRVRRSLRKRGVCLKCKARRANAAGFRNKKKLCKLRVRKPAWCSPCRKQARSERQRLAILQQLIHGPFTVIQIAAAFRLTHRTMLRRIKPMLVDATIERWVDDDAGRAWLRLTQKGWRAIGAAR